MSDFGPVLCNAMEQFCLIELKMPPNACSSFHAVAVSPYYSIMCFYIHMLFLLLHSSRCLSSFFTFWIFSLGFLLQSVVLKSTYSVTDFSLVNLYVFMVDYNFSCTKYRILNQIWALLTEASTTMKMILHKLPSIAFKILVFLNARHRNLDQNQ